MVKILCQIPNREELLELEVGSGWTLANIRQEICIALGDDDVEEHAANWKMRITKGGQIQEKVLVLMRTNALFILLFYF